MTCLSCNKNKAPTIIEDGYFILSFYGISLNKKKTPICHDKMTHLPKKCVTLKELMDRFHLKIDLSDVICQT